MSQTSPRASTRSRSVALVGPYGSGKSTLFEALLAAAGTPLRRNPGPRGRSMSTGLRLCHASYLGEAWSILDCPGSVEFAHEVAGALSVVDLAVLVCEPAPERALVIAPALKALAEASVPHIVFINKIDTLAGRVRDTLAAVQAHSARPLVLRQVPIRESESVTGYIDVVSERAYRYREGQPSELIRLPPEMAARGQEARTGLLETLADHDDELLEKILEDVAPSNAEIFGHLHKELGRLDVVEVMFGAAERQQGIQRLWKALRHDVPTPEVTASRHGIAAEGEPLAQIFKTVHAGHGGKLSLARIWRGPVRDGASFDNAKAGGARVGGVFRMAGDEPVKIAEAETGELIGLGRLDGIPTGATLGGPETLPWPEPSPPVYALAITTENRKDDVKLSGVLQKLVEEDPSLVVEHDPETGETLLKGQGEIHLNAAIDRLAKAFNLGIATARPRVKFKETIRHAVHQHARLKRQTGGHGQFADVKLEVEPRERGAGFQFTDRIVGGSVPRQYIPAVGDAAEEATRKGVFGYPVVDVAVTLVDGGFHSVDSSDMAFKTATRIGMSEALAKADPMLLEPIDQVTISVPNAYTASAQRLITGRRGRILGYGERPGWPGWDDVEALVPEAELHDFIIELRSLTMGLGTYRWRFDHLAEARGPLAERIAQEAASAGR